MKDSHSKAYAEAGVDITAGYKAVELMKKHVARTMTSGVCSDVGGFGGLFELDVKGMERPVLVSGTDGVGTKLKIAFLLDKHDTVGIDCVAMCVNDVICCGAKPLFFLDYVACGKNVPERIADVVKGVYNYCQTIFNFPCAFIPCITIAIIPAITNSLTLQDRRGVRSVQNSSLRLMGLIAMPCAVGLIVLAEPIVALLGGYTGANLTLATKLMAILGVAVVFNSIVLMTDAIMQAHNHAVIPVVNTLIGGIVKVIVNYILVGNPDSAITGAPVGTIACYAVITVLNLIAMRRVLRRNAPKLLPNLWKTTIAAVLMGGTTWLAYWGLGRIGMGRAVACLGSIVVAVLVYVVLIIVLKVLTYEDCLLLPKGEKIAKILRVR